MGEGGHLPRDEIAALRLGLDPGVTRTWRCDDAFPPRRGPEPLAML